MGCIFPENKLGALRVGGREWGAAVWEENTPVFPYFFWGGGIMWVWEWVAGFCIWVPHQPATVVAPQLPGKQVSHPCDLHTFYR